MIRAIDGEKWQTDLGEKPLFYELPDNSIVQVETRSEKGVTIHGVTVTGELVFLGAGQHVELKLRLEGFKALELTPSGPFAARAVVLQSSEQVDPTRIELIQGPDLDPMKEAALQLLRDEIAKRNLKAMFESDEELLELMDDLENGDLDFEEEPDPFGLTAHQLVEQKLVQERVEAEFRAEEEARAARQARKDRLEPQNPPAEGGSASPAPAPTPPPEGA